MGRERRGKDKKADEDEDEGGPRSEVEESQNGKKSWV